MQVRVRLFAMLRAREGADQIEINLDDDASAAQLVDQFFATRPGLDSLRPHLRLGLNGALVARDANLSQIRVQPDDEIALLLQQVAARVGGVR